MKKILLMALCVVCGNAWADDSKETLAVNGVRRSYVLHVSANAGDKPSLLLVFHGAGGSGEQMARVLNSTQVDKDDAMNALADRNHMMVVYPDGMDHRWNDGRAATAKYGDDVVFISNLIDHLVTQFGVNPKKVYATGLSNGAMFSHRLGCELSDKIAAIAPVSGLMPSDLAAHCKPSQGISVFMIQGTGDSFMPAAGGEITKGLGGKVFSDEQTIELWSEMVGCKGNPEMRTEFGYHVFSMFHQRQRTPAAITFLEYKNCGGKQVQLAEIKDGGHMWPGSYSNFGALLGTGKVSDFPANAEIMDFFLHHPKP